MHAVEHYHITNNVRHCHVHCAYFIILYRTIGQHQSFGKTNKIPTYITSLMMCSLLCCGLARMYIYFYYVGC